MKRSLAPLLLVACASASASTYTTLALQTSDGTEQTITAVGTRITFSDGNVKAVNGTESLTLSLADMSSMYFTGLASAVQSLNLSEVSILAGEGQISVAAPEGTLLTLTNLSGRTIARVTATGEVQTLATALNKGIYIVGIGTETIKTLVR